MDTNYTAVPPKDVFVELQLKEGDFESDIPQENGYTEQVNADDLELDDDIDLDNLPLIFGDGNKPGSGIHGAVFNLTTTIVGAGIMALPAAMKVLGFILGFVLIILIGILSEMSVELLIRFSVQCNVTSYGEVVHAALGKTARMLSETCIIVNNAGVLVVYLIIIGDVMSGSVHHIGVLDQWLGQGFWDHRKFVVLIFLIFFLAPLCALDKIDSLSLTSGASVALAVIFVIVSFVIAFVKLVEGTIEIPRMAPDFGSTNAILDLFVVIPIMSNAYVCHFNVLPIYNELEERSPEKMYRVGRVTTVICVLVYVSTAVSGYLLFGKETESDVLTNFDKDLGIPFSAALTYIVRMGYVFHLILVFPVIHFSLRQAVDALFFKDYAPLTESRRRCLALTVVLLGLVYLSSTMVPNIWTVFKFTGATTAVSLGFTFPSLIALQLSKEGNRLSKGERKLCWLMLVLSIMVSILGVCGNVYSIEKLS
ncbi:unnamed protein product [Cuscuta epithymum]|uniref:Amino acid transporter transmembrane domain-containing protein n=1 Tax=Cuscuta epithymum TaxID=186058 RepID=A0AAV0D9N0_9ASTE|nr:unnamed protein product [Cuscuta epithymum]